MGFLKLPWRKKKETPATPMVSAPLPIDESEIQSVTGLYQLAGTQLDEATKAKKDARSAAQRLLDLMRKEKKNP